MKGKRAAFSAMIDEHGFNKGSVDIFDCDTDHSMNSDHFIQRIEDAVFGLRKKSGPSRRIPIVIDNGAGHNEFTDSTKPPKCSWRKDQVQTCLREHNIDFNIDLQKSELLQLAFVNLPRKEYKVDLMKAKMFDVEILRLPIKHCSFNPIELAG